MSGQGNEGREELVPFCIKLLLMVQVTSAGISGPLNIRCGVRMVLG